MGYRVAVVGATGAVGREMLETLDERSFPVDDVVALASERSAGQTVSFGEDNELKVEDLAKFDFKGIDIVMSSPGGAVSAHVLGNALANSSLTEANSFSPARLSHS